MLPAALLFHALAIGLLIGSTMTGAPAWQLTGIGIVAGASIPQVGALTAARWSAALRGSPTISSAFALESLGNGLAFLVGPALIGTVSTLTAPALGSALATALVLAGGFALALQRRTAPPPATVVRSPGSPTLLRPGFAALVGANVGIGLFLGAMQVSVTAFAVDLDAAGLAGPLYSVTSLVSMIAGLGYGLRRWRTPASTQLVIALGLLGLCCLPLLAAGSPLELGLALALPGVVLAPCLILTSVLTESRVEPAVHTQAFTWLNSGSAAGIAVAAAVTGQVVDSHEPRWGFALATAAAALATAAALAGRNADLSRRVSRPDGHRRTRRGRPGHLLPLLRRQAGGRLR